MSDQQEGVGGCLIDGAITFLGVGAIIAVLSLVISPTLADRGPTVMLGAMLAAFTGLCTGLYVLVRVGMALKAGLGLTVRPVAAPAPAPAPTLLVGGALRHPMALQIATGLGAVVLHVCGSDIARVCGPAGPLVRPLAVVLCLVTVVLHLRSAAAAAPAPTPAPLAPGPPESDRWAEGPQFQARPRLGPRAGRYVLEGRYRGAEFVQTTDAEGRLELQVRPVAKPTRLPRTLDPTSSDARVTELARRGCTGMRVLGPLVVVSTSRPPETVLEPEVAALLDLVFDLVAAPPETVPVALAATGGEVAVCPWCRDGLRDDVDVTACPSCSTRHHAECFVLHGGCTVLGCAGRPRTRERA